MFSNGDGAAEMFGFNSRVFSALMTHGSQTHEAGVTRASNARAVSCLSSVNASVKTQVDINPYSTTDESRSKSQCASSVMRLLLLVFSYQVYWSDRGLIISNNSAFTLYSKHG